MKNSYEHLILRLKLSIRNLGIDLNRNSYREREILTKIREEIDRESRTDFHGATDPNGSNKPRKSEHTKNELNTDAINRRKENSI